MSRVGRKPIKLPSGVELDIQASRVIVQGPKGSLETSIPAGIRLELNDGTAEAKRTKENPKTRALHGLFRSLVANAVSGVSEGFSKQLDLVGIGYRAEIRGKALSLSIGFSHKVEFPFPEGIEIKVEKGTSTIPNYVATMTILGIDKAQVGQVAADIRKFRPPDAYKGKGIRYCQEVVRTKVGKKGA